VRICSLLPSATEIVAALGLTESLVAVSEECDWPPEVRGLPVATASRVDTKELSGLRIDRAVRAALADGRSLYAIDAELLERLKPDVILTQDLCSVCAVSGAEVAELCATEAEVLACDAHTLTEIGQGILQLADTLGAGQRGEEVAQGMQHVFAHVKERVAGARRRAVFVAEWLDPPYVSGHWIPEMVGLAGGREVLGRAGLAAYPTTWDVVRRSAPELVVAAPCGYDHGRAAQEAAQLNLGCPVVAVDANAYYARPAPRVTAGVEQLAFLLHPDLVEDPGLPWVEL
jgi:iron complex transport system substrate-binding protein